MKMKILVALLSVMLLASAGLNVMKLLNASSQQEELNSQREEFIGDVFFYASQAAWYIEQYFDTPDRELFNRRVFVERAGIRLFGLDAALTVYPNVSPVTRGLVGLNTMGEFLTIIYAYPYWPTLMGSGVITDEDEEYLRQLLNGLNGLLAVLSEPNNPAAANLSLSYAEIEEAICDFTAEFSNWWLFR